MQIIIVVIGVVLTIYGSILSIMSNFNLGVILTLMLGISVLIYGIFRRKINDFSSKGIFKTVKIILCIFMCMELVLIGFIAVYGQNDNIDFNEDAVIVLGAGVHGDKVTLPLKQRLDKAIEYHHKNPYAVIVVTGGQGFQETVTEAYAMEKYLVINGVDEKIIIKEEEATSTNENMKFSKKILDSYFSHEYKTVVITNNFHILRAVSIAKNEGFEKVVHMHADLHWYNYIPCYLRESLAVLKMLVFG